MVFGGLKRKVVSGFELVDTTLIDIEADNAALAAKFNGEGKADITQTNDRQLDIF